MGDQVLVAPTLKNGRLDSLSPCARWGSVDVVTPALRFCERLYVCIAAMHKASPVDLATSIISRSIHGIRIIRDTMTAGPMAQSSVLIQHILIG